MEEIIMKALMALICQEDDRAAKNPFGNWADDSREISAQARSALRELQSGHIQITRRWQCDAVEG